MIELNIYKVDYKKNKYYVSGFSEQDAITKLKFHLGEDIKKYDIKLYLGGCLL